MLFMLKGSKIVSITGSGWEVLRWAQGSGREVLGLLIELDIEHERLLALKRKAENEARKRI